MGESLRQYIREYHVYMIIWKPLTGEYLQYLKNPTKEVAKNTVDVVRTNSQRKEELVGHVQQKPHGCNRVSIPSPLRFGHLCRWKMRQPCT